VAVRDPRFGSRSGLSDSLAETPAQGIVDGDEVALLRCLPVADRPHAERGVLVSLRQGEPRGEVRKIG